MTHTLFRLPAIALVSCFLLMPSVSLAGEPTADEPATKPAKLKVLLVAGGCCHDYAAQSKLLKEKIEQRIHAEVTVELSKDSSTKARFEVYESDNWAEGYDVVIHDECSADVVERPYVSRILAAHRAGTPAVNLHCAMHSYRWGDYKKPVDPDADNAGWFEMIGVQSSGHGPQAPIDVLNTASDHPITKGMEDWRTVNEELYNNVRVYAGTSALVSGKQMTPPWKGELKKNPDAKPRESMAVVAWTSQYGDNKTRIFSTSLGHNNETVSDDRYVDLVTRGILWVTKNLSDEGASDHFCEAAKAAH